jgi:hypothetical protein
MEILSSIPPEPNGRNKQLKADVEFTPVQRRILAVLSDGMPHRKQELHPCLNDDLATSNAIQVHISAMRKILRPKGEDIVCEYNKMTYYYRHIRLLQSAYR